MYHSDEIIRQLQENKILATKLDNAVAGMRNMVTNQVKTIGAGATRLLYYTSCFTDEYHDVCLRQKEEDIRFGEGIVQLINDRNAIYEMIRLYLEIIFKPRTMSQLEYIKTLLMRANVHIAASSLTNQGFTLDVTASVVLGFNASIAVRTLTGRVASGAATVLGIYGIVQNAADCSQRLHYSHPEYYQLLYSRNLEMLFFLIEPMFEKAGALRARWMSDEDVADTIIKMVR